MSTWKNRKVADVAAGFMWWMTYGGLQESMEMLKPSHSDRQVVITYHWRHKEWAILVKLELEQLGYRVWFDLDWEESESELGFESRWEHPFLTWIF